MSGATVTSAKDAALDAALDVGHASSAHASRNHSPDASLSCAPDASPSAAADASLSASQREQRIRAASIAKYRRRAQSYDALCRRTWPIRERAVAALHLEPGMCVLDVGCGTGLSLQMLRERVGESGHVYGVDQSPDMAQRAMTRVRANGWSNVSVLQAAAQDVQLPGPVDALLFHYTHDILHSAAAIGNLLSMARPGARVAIAGIKYFPSWLAPLNLWVYLKNAPYNGAPGGLRRPWELVAGFVSDLSITPTQFGMGYLAVARVPDDPRAR